MTLVFLEISIGGERLGKLVFRLFEDIAPRTCENFRLLCTGEKGSSHRTTARLHYKTTRIHRVIPGFVIQGGDITSEPNRLGFGGDCAFDGSSSTFDDENFTIQHDSRALLSMANCGPNTNASQFFVTLAAAPQLDGHHVCFGKLAYGKRILKRIERVKLRPRDTSGRPLVQVLVVDCGIFTEDMLEAEKKRRKDKKRRHRKKHRGHRDRDSKDGRRDRRRKRHRSKDLDVDAGTASALKRRRLSDVREERTYSGLTNEFGQPIDDLQVVFDRAEQHRRQESVEGRRKAYVPERRVYRGRGDRKYRSGDEG